jgi:hypothetical protein
MNSRTLALLLTVLAGGSLLFLASDEVVLAPGLAGALLAIAAIWLASGRVRWVLGLLSEVLWLVATALAIGVSPAVVLACLAGVAGAGIVVAKGRGWPGWSSRYARATDLDEDETISPRLMWESLDRGQDPTRHGDGASEGE